MKETKKTTRRRFLKASLAGAAGAAAVELLDLLAARVAHRPAARAA
ncbi:MAG: twin-arginine translocation signal domain-containing protein, partial [Planctomycetota bacterium]